MGNSHIGIALQLSINFGILRNSFSKIISLTANSVLYLYKSSISPKDLHSYRTYRFLLLPKSHMVLSQSSTLGPLILLLVPSHVPGGANTELRFGNSGINSKLFDPATGWFTKYFIRGDLPMMGMVAQVACPPSFGIPSALMVPLDFRKSPASWDYPGPKKGGGSPVFDPGPIKHSGIPFTPIPPTPRK